MKALDEIKQYYILEAQGIKEYNLLSKTEMCNAYCDAEEAGDAIKASRYWAAIILRYWYKIPQWIQNSMSLNLQPEDFIMWLEDCLKDTLYYRSWRWEYLAVVKNGKFISWKLDSEGNKILNEHYWKLDPNAPDKSMNYFYAAKRGKMYQYANKDMRKGNTQTISIEGTVDENGRQMDCFGSTPSKSIDGAYELVELFLKSNKPLEALVIDGIAYQDSFKSKKEKIYRLGVNSQGKEVNKRYMTETEEFNIRKLVKHLNSIDSNFMRDYFCKTYLISEDKGKEILQMASSLSNPKWYKYIQKTFVEIKDNKTLLSCLTGN